MTSEVCMSHKLSPMPQRCLMGEDEGPLTSSILFHFQVKTGIPNSPAEEASRENVVVLRLHTQLTRRETDCLAQAVELEL